MKLIKTSYIYNTKTIKHKLQTSQKRLESFDNTYQWKILENFCQNFDKYNLVCKLNLTNLRPKIIEIQINF